MIQLTNFPDDTVFYRGTIIVLKGINKTPEGVFDSRYCMVLGYGGFGNFMMMDLHRNMGGIIIHELEPNVPGHVGVNKTGIREWVKDFFKYLYDEAWLDKIDEITYIENLDEYFTQTNKDITV